jgi:hypothetical protein
MLDATVGPRTRATDGRRGLPAVRSEWALMNVSHNIAKLYGHNTSPGHALASPAPRAPGPAPTPTPARPAACWMRDPEGKRLLRHGRLLAAATLGVATTELLDQRNSAQGGAPIVTYGVPSVAQD